MRILFAGDIMPGGVLPYQKEYISADMLSYLKEFDLRVGTLESAIGDNLPFDEVKMKGKKNIIYARNADLSRVVEMGFDVVSLANNHIYDLGAEGLDNTISQLEKLGIPHCGAGRNLEEASRPAVVRIGDKKIAFYAYCQYNSVYIGHLQIATENSPGVNPLDIDRCVSDIKDAKGKYDFVFVLPHWGNEYQYAPTPLCVAWAKKMIEAGADGVFASHTHQIQPLVKYKKRPIAYSLGNCLFPDYYMQPPRPIWYPDKEEIPADIKRIENYPKSIDKPCIQVWRHLSRVGMLAEWKYAHSNVCVDYRLTYLSKDNILEFYDYPNALKQRMKWMAGMTMMPDYKLIYDLYNSRLNVARRGYHLISKPFKRK